MLRKERITPISSIILALLGFLASQHHTIHMLLLTVGVGGAGMSFMTMFPIIRRVMLLLSLIMTGWSLYQLWRGHRPKPMQIAGGISAALSLALVVWSVYRYGI